MSFHLWYQKYIWNNNLRLLNINIPHAKTALHKLEEITIPTLEKNKKNNDPWQLNVSLSWTFRQPRKNNIMNYFPSNYSFSSEFYKKLTPRSLLTSSLFRTASWMCLGIIRVFLLALAAFPSNSRPWTN